MIQHGITLIIPPDNKAFWGGIIGAIIGTFGALLAALIAVWADRRKTKSEYQKGLLRKYNHYLVTTETALNELIPLLIKNTDLLQKCIDAKDVGNFMMNLPRTIRLSSENVGDYISRQLVNNWLTLTIRTKMCDELIEDFTSSYKEIRELVFNSAALGTKVDVSMITSHKEQLLDFATSAKKSAEKLEADCLQMLAMLQLHGELIKSEKTKFKDTKSLENYELDEEKISEKIDKLKVQFDHKKILGEA